jgi:hypothetical protein
MRLDEMPYQRRAMGLQALGEEAHDGVTEKLLAVLKLDDMVRCRPDPAGA